MTNTLSFDKVLDRIGPFGQYQVFNLVLIGLAGIPIGAYNLANVFLAGLPVYLCKRNSTYLSNGAHHPSSDFYNGSSNQINYHTNGLTDDNEDNGKHEFYDNGIDQTDQCQAYYTENSINGTTADGSTSYTECNSWSYDTSVFESTIVTEWDLVCSSEWQIALAQSTYMLGFLLGAVGFGSLSDKIGRKKAWFMSLIMMIISSTAAAFMPDYWGFIGMRFVSGIAAAGAFTCGFVITMEVIGMEYRMKPGVFYQGWFAVGYMLMALVAYFIRDFRYLQLLLGLIPIVFIPYYWLLGESPRWLLAEGKMKQAALEVKRAARMNKREFPDDLLTYQKQPLMQSTESVSSSGSVVDLLRTPNMRRKSINTFFNWFVNSLVYYGLSMSTGDLIGGPYINLFLSGAMEFPGYLIAVLTLDRVGRRLPLAGLLMCGGICCLLMAVIPAEFAVTLLTFSMLGKMCISGSFAVIYVYSAELCPTVVRNVGVGTGSMFARVGGLISPFVALLGSYWAPLPLLVFGSFSILAAALTLLLPETLHQDLPETLEDGEKFGRDAHKNIFNFIAKRKPHQHPEATDIKHTDTNTDPLSDALTDADPSLV